MRNPIQRAKLEGMFWGMVLTASLTAIISAALSVRL